jgi:TetR/AcrR family fatty acid metabolism transcriptional regulator
VTESRFSSAATSESEAPSPPKKAGKSKAARPAREGDKRERILRAATKVFARKGFYATRVSEVAKAAGVADGTIYLYFQSKDDLLVSLFEDRVVLLLAALERELEKRDTPRDRLRAIIELQLGLLEGERDLAEVITVNLRQSTRLMKQYAAPKFNLYLETIARVVHEGQKSGDFRDDVSPSVVARAIFGALDGLTMTWALGKADAGGLSRAATQDADVLLSGLENRAVSGR